MISGFIFLIHFLYTEIYEKTLLLLFPEGNLAVLTPFIEYSLSTFNILFKMLSFNTKIFKFNNGHIAYT